MQEVNRILFYKLRRYALLIIIVVISGFACYWLGYGAGMLGAFTLVADNVESMVDMKLTPPAKNMLKSNPLLLSLMLTPESLEKFFDDKGKSLTPTWATSINISKLNITK